MTHFELQVTSTMGLLLAISLLAGLVAEFLHVPKVTAYLLAGLVLGGSGLNLLPQEHLTSFDPILELAMALVLFSLGCTFSFSRLRRIAMRGLTLSLAELAATFLLVAIGLLAFGVDWEVALLLACLALATAPATTVLVLKELRSEGPVTEATGFLVALNNLAAIVTFEVMLLVVSLFHGQTNISLASQITFLCQGILGSVLAGAAAGLVMSYCCELLRPSRWLCCW